MNSLQENPNCALAELKGKELLIQTEIVRGFERCRTGEAEGGSSRAGAVGADREVGGETEMSTEGAWKRGLDG